MERQESAGDHEGHHEHVHRAKDLSDGHECP